MMKYQHFLVFLFCLSEARRLARFTDFYFESIKVLHENSTIPFVFTITALKRSGRDNPKMFLEFYLTEPLRNIEIESKIYWSPPGNRRFMLVPYKVARQSLCGAVNHNDGFTQAIARDLQNYSNIPYTEDPNVDFCDLMPLGYYFVRNYSMDPSLLPSVTPPGRFRFALIYYKKFQKEVLQGIEFQSVFT